MTGTIDSFALDQWYVVGSTTELRPEHPRHTALQGQPIVVAREPNGAASVRTEGPDVWQLPVEERYGYLWTSLGQPNKPLIDMPEFDEPGRRLVICGAITVRTSGPRIIENFLDMAHFPYVHPGVLGSEAATEVANYKVEHRDDVDELWATECGFKQPQAMAASEGETEVDYLYRVAEPCSSILYKSSPGKPDAMDLIGIFVQPREETHSDAHCFMLVYDDSSSDDFLIQWQQSIFLQDRTILENQRPLRLPLAPREELPIKADAMSTAYRKWLQSHGLTYGVIPANG